MTPSSTTTEADRLLKNIVSRRNVDLDISNDVDRRDTISKIIDSTQVAVNLTRPEYASDAEAQKELRLQIVGELCDAPLPTALDDLFHLIEAAFIKRELYGEAQAVTYMLSLRSEGDVDHQVRLVRRNRQIVPWSMSKIESAVRRAFISVHADPSPAVRIARAVTARVKADANSLVGIEDVQDMVQEELMKQAHYAVASHYILYRAERAKLRAETTDDAPAMSEITVVNGRNKAPFDPVEIRRRINYAGTGLDLCLSKKEITKELLRSVGGEISKEDLKNTIILNAKTLLEKDADFGKFAGRILLTYIYEEVLDWDILRDGLGQLKKAHRQSFTANLKRGVKIGRIDPAILERYDLEELASKLDPSADMDFDYLGLQTLYDRYLIVDKTGKKARRLETPQFFWMRVAMGLFKEEGRIEGCSEHSLTRPFPKAGGFAVQLYNLYKSRRFCSSTPTLFNSGTPHSQLSSCYLYEVDDSIESIFQRGIADNAYLSKFAGGLGGSWTKVRGTGAHIKGTNGESQGVIPFLKVYNDMLNSCNQGGKRRGSGCAYLETWHNDIEDFLELRKNVGDDRRRCHDMNTANWIPDLFMKRMEARQDWTLFRSNEVADLPELYGKAFDRRYEEYEALAAAGKIWSRTLPALELWKTMLKSIFETGHAWLTWKDPCNVRSPQDHVGVVHSSNLCLGGDCMIATRLGAMRVEDLWKSQGMADISDGAVATVDLLVNRRGVVTSSVVTRTSVTAALLEIRLSSGKSLKVTPNHEFITVDPRIASHVLIGGRSEDEVRVKASDLKEGDVLLYAPRLMTGDVAGRYDVSYVVVTEIGDGGVGATYCVNEPLDHEIVVDDVITGNCTEITLNTDAESVAVCNLGSVLLDEHLLPDGTIDHPKLKETVTLAVRALDNVIDINFYPVEAARNSNVRHRPIGLGMMGLQNALHKKGLAFASQEAVEFNDEITEAVAFYAYSASTALAKEKGAYSTYKGSKWDRGLLPQDTIDLLQEERGIEITTPRGGLMDWAPVRASIAAHGMRNSNVMAIAPTATISLVMNTTPCIEPNYKNLFVKSNMSGDFTVLSETLVRELKALGLWDQSMLDQLKYHDGELDTITEIPDEVKARHLTVFGIPYEYIIDAAARRQKWIDQSQSLNLFLPEADMKALSRMYRYAWSSGLKTTYYLRTLGASGIEKSTVDAGKAPRGLVAEAAPAPAPVMLCRIDDPECQSCQ